MLGPSWAQGASSLHLGLRPCLGRMCASTASLERLGPGSQRPGKGLQKAQVLAGSGPGCCCSQRGPPRSHKSGARRSLRQSSRCTPRYFWRCYCQPQWQQQLLRAVSQSGPAPFRFPLLRPRPRPSSGHQLQPARSPPQPCRLARGPAAAAPAWSRRAPPALRRPLGPSPSSSRRGLRASAPRLQPTHSPPCLWSLRKPCR